MSFINAIREAQRENNPDGEYVSEKLESIYKDIKDFPGSFRYVAEMVPAVPAPEDNVNEASYYADLNSTLRYMKENTIESIREALQNIKKVNGLEEDAVIGLLVSDIDTNSIKESVGSHGSLDRAYLESTLDFMESMAKLTATDIPLYKI